MLILCEKPSVAKDFAAALGASAKKGFFEGSGNVITYCVGHLFELYHPEDYDPKYKKWALDALPIIPGNFKYHVSPGTAEQAKLVMELLKKHSGGDILIATDAGREGELIARIAIQEAGINNLSRFRRFWVSEALTQDVIRKGIREAKPFSEYDALSAQAFARQRGDWLVGMNLTRLMSIGNPPPPWTVGRVQTAVLSAVGERNEEVKNFVPVPYKELEADLSTEDNITIKALLENSRTGKTAFFAEDEDYLLAAKKDCDEKNIDAVDVDSKEGKKKPEKLLNITGLQKRAFKKYGYKPEETLALAQALYEVHKCLSYPRTPSRVMGDNNVDLFREKFELLKGVSELSAFCDPSLINADNKHIFNSAKLEDHHALIPLNKLPESANEKERNVYSIVLESFFVVCMPDFIFNEKSLRFHVGEYVFTSRIREVLQYGWKKAHQNNLVQKDDEEEDNVMELKHFDETNCSISALQIQQKKTQAKKEFAIDTLLAFMEHPREEGESKLAGLGTPATRAEIIKKLFAAEYVKEEKKKLYATDRGRFLLAELSKNEHLAKMADVSQTTEWEEKLSQNPIAFEKEIVEYVTQCVKESSGHSTFQSKPLGACPLCKKPVYETKLAYGCSGYKDDPRCNFAIWKTIAGAAVTVNDAQLLLIGQKTKVKKCKSKAGKEFEAAFALKGGEIEFLFKKN